MYRIVRYYPKYPGGFFFLNFYKDIFEFFLFSIGSTWNTVLECSRHGAVDIDFPQWKTNTVINLNLSQHILIKLLSVLFVRNDFSSCNIINTCTRIKTSLSYKSRDTYFPTVTVVLLDFPSETVRIIKKRHVSSCMPAKSLVVTPGSGQKTIKIIPVYFFSSDLWLQRGMSIRSVQHYTAICVPATLAVTRAEVVFFVYPKRIWSFCQADEI